MTTGDPPRRLLLVISSLSGGGAERVATLLARGWIDHGYHVALVTIFGRDRDFYTLPAGVERHALNLGGESRGLFARIAANARRIRALRRTICAATPDVVISFMPQTNVLSLLAAGRRGPPVIVTEHADPRRFPLPGAWEWLRRRCYPRAARLVSVSPSVDTQFDWLPADRRCVIPNPVVVENATDPPVTPPFPWPRAMIGMGRLAPEKGFDRLIEAFARLAKDFPDWGLTILGEGTERPRLEALIARHELSTRVSLPGAAPAPFPLLRAADLFVLSSLTEGFGNALVEALACGLPVVATDCWDGPQDIMRDGVEGLIVPGDDTAALAAGMRRMMADDSLRRACAARAEESARRFALDRVMLSWEAALRGIFDL
jgi:GalNAc-alpha-(1->4)-GalNAc-alpha-(1->3)-diNAcBac-PP-undecaprenol alpha-1,4-N-acetyl-D-galactosaminyltransferase